MADDGAGAQFPAVNAAMPTSSRNSSAPSAPNTQTKRKQKPRKNATHAAQAPHTDGTVSDTTSKPHASLSLPSAPKPRHQSVAMGVLPTPSDKHSNGQKHRQTCFAGQMPPSTPLKEQAYAGPTFQASPAPSSLPVPKFFSKSVPNVARPSFEARAVERNSPEAGYSSPDTDTVSPEPLARTSQQTPLDLFFQADRVEKEKRRSASMLSSDPQRARTIPATEPRNGLQQTSKSAFLHELDGETSQSTASLDPRNGYASPPRPHTAHEHVPRNEIDERQAYTQSLKDLLFSNINSATPSHVSQPESQLRGHIGPAYGTPSPVQRPASGPGTPTPFTPQQQPNYALHYGNRNLSPLFQAARSNDTPPTRSSGLRQHEPVDSPQLAQQRQSLPPDTDPDSFSRRPLPNGSLHGLNARSPPPHPDPFQAYHQHPTVPANRSSPRTTSTSTTIGGPSNPRDIKGMEDDLRRMLNLNVLSN